MRCKRNSKLLDFKDALKILKNFLIQNHTKKSSRPAFTPVYLAQSTITCLKLTTKTLEQGMKYVQS